MADYAVLVHDRETEDDPQTGTVIYTRDGTHWHAMVTGHMDYCVEVMDALCFKEYKTQEEQAESLARLREELNRD